VRQRALVRPQDALIEEMTVCVDTLSTHQRDIRHPMLEPRYDMALQATAAVECGVSAIEGATVEHNGMYLCDNMRLVIHKQVDVVRLAVVDIKCHQSAHSPAFVSIICLI
jgi:hypothetical protein